MTPNPYPGKFIVFEGGEGVGKTTQVGLLVERMKREGLPVLQTREPTKESVFGRLVRFIYECESLYKDLPPKLAECIGDKEYRLAKEMAEDAHRRHLTHFEKIAKEIRSGDHTKRPIFLQLGMTFDGHSHLVKTILPNLGRGVHVVTDRWRPSSVAYGEAAGINTKLLWDMQQEVLKEHYIAPDLMIMLDVPTNLGHERTLKKQGVKKELHDEFGFMEKVRNAYHKIAQNKTVARQMNITVIDGTGAPEEVHDRIWKMARPLLEKTQMTIAPLET